MIREKMCWGDYETCGHCQSGKPIERGTWSSENLNEIEAIKYQLGETA